MSMQFVRNLGRAFATSLLSGLLLILPVLFALHTTIGKPEPVKQALRNSGIYSNVVTSIVENAATDSKDPVTKQLLADPGVKHAVTDAFSAQFVQANAEQSVDKVYAWLEGKTDTLQLSLNTTDARQKLIQNLTNYAHQRAATLPTCTRAQLLVLNPNSDILSIPCIPPGVNSDALASQFGEQIANQLNLPEQQAQPVKTPEGAQKSRFIFQAFTTKFWILPLLVALLIISFVFLHRNKVLGLKRAGRMILGSGILLGVLFGVFVLIIGRTIRLISDSNSGMPAIQQNITAAIGQLLSTFEHATLYWVIGYIVVGAGILLSLYYRKKGSVSPPANPVTPPSPQV